MVWFWEEMTKSITKSLFLRWILWSSKFNLHYLLWMQFKKEDGCAPPRSCIILKTHETAPSVATGLRIAENSKNWPNFKNTWVITANVSKLIGLTILKVCIKKYIDTTVTRHLLTFICFLFELLITPMLASVSSLSRMMHADE